MATIKLWDVEELPKSKRITDVAKRCFAHVPTPKSGSLVTSEVEDIEEQQPHQPNIPDGYPNAFINMLHTAFMTHTGVSISPDDIWIQILHGLSLHEKLTGSLGEVLGLSEKERKELTVRRWDTNWALTFNVFEDLIKKNVKDKSMNEHLFVNFTTTKPVHSRARSIALMTSLTKYFTYRFITMSHISKITLLGKRSDWKKMWNSANELSKNKKLGLSTWLSAICQILQKCLELFDGKADKKFWKSIYHYESGSGSDNVNGWCTFLYPYVYYNKKLVKSVALDYVGWLTNSKKSLAKIKIDPANFPGCYFNAPVIWERQDMMGAPEFDCMVYSGLFGYRPDESGDGLQTSTGWLVWNNGLLKKTDK